MFIDKQDSVDVIHLEQEPGEMPPQIQKDWPQGI